MKIVSVVGRKNTGKTSLTVRIIEELVRRGYKVATIKHSHHTMEMDKENTDTWRHKNAGSELVVGIGSTSFFNVKEILDLNRILYLIKTMGNFDFVVIEGFKSYKYPKIATSDDVVDEFTIKKVDSFSITYDEVKELVTKIENHSCDIIDTLFLDNCGFNDGEAIAKEIIKGNISTEELDKVDVALAIDNKVIGLNEFVADYIKQTMLGIVNSLNIDQYGAKDLNKIELIIDNREKRENKIELKEKKISLTINGKDIGINKFVNNFLIDTLTGMLNSLKIDNHRFNNVEIEITNKTDLTLIIDDKIIEINQFVNNIMIETIQSMVSSLNNIDEDIETLKIKIC